MLEMGKQARSLDSPFYIALLSAALFTLLVCSITYIQSGFSYANLWPLFASAAIVLVSITLLLRCLETYRLKASAIELSREGIAILGPDENYIFANQELARIFGYNSPQELIGLSWIEHYGEEERLRFTNHLLPRFQARGYLSVEAIGTRKDGSTFPHELSLTRLEGGRSVCVLRDITLRKKVERNAEQVALFATLNPSPELRFDASGNIIMANPAAISIFNLMDGNSSHLSSFLPGINQLHIEEVIEHAAIESLTADIDGRTFHFVIKGISYLGAGHLYGTDITDLKKAERELIESQDFLRTILDTDPNFIFVKDREGRFRLVNQAVADVYGTTVNNMIGKTDSDYNDNLMEVEHFRSDDLDVIDNHSEKLVQEEVITDSKGTTRYLQTVKRPLMDRKTGEVHVLGVSTDISDRKDLQKQLIQSHKLEAIGKLAGGIAHDFNNILTGILGYTNLLRIEYESNPELVNTAELIENAASQACQLTQKLLGFARKGKHRNVPIDIHQSIQETLGLLGRTIEKNISIKQSLDAECYFVLGDPVQIQQILLNLAINARDAMSMDSSENPDGQIVITTKLVCVTEENFPFYTDLSPGEYVEVAVTDTGCGMKDEVKDRIFDPFFTTKEAGKGTGMGLSMVYGIVKNHGGAIHVQSAPGEGATFRVFLPVTQRKNVVEVEQVEKTKPIPGHGQILLVDDHSVIRDATSKMLSSLGYDVATANDGREAVRYFEENSVDVDLVIIDMVMPNMGARECFRKIKKIQPGVRAILSTGYVNNNAVQDILNEGMLGFVQKPYQIKQLSEVVEQVLKQ